MIDFFSLPQEKRNELVTKFHAYTDKGDGKGCWIWKGAMDQDKYGLIRVRGRNEIGKSIILFQTRSHRLSWMMHYNCPIPKGLLCMHSCDNPSCVSPLHIAIGTAKQNMQECLLKDRKYKKKRAERLKIAEAVFRGLSIKQAAKKFGIGSTAVFRYVKSKESVEQFGHIDLSQRISIGPSLKPLPSLI